MVAYPINISIHFHTLAVLIHGTLGGSHATVQSSHANILHLAKVHLLTHWHLVMHPLHGLEENTDTSYHNAFSHGWAKQVN